MTAIFVHGLGQGPKSWGPALLALGLSEKDAACPSLPGLLPPGEAAYSPLYKAFCAYCAGFSGPLRLCGLSLGAVLALHYALDHPERVEKLALLAPQYKMPVRLLKIQDMLFRLMPRKAFDETGFDKEAFRSLSRSMETLDFSERVPKLAVPTLVLCGEKDRANRSAAGELTKLLPKGRLALIPGAGHEVNREQPQLLAQALKGFW